MSPSSYKYIRRPVSASLQIGRKKSGPLSLPGDGTSIGCHHSSQKCPLMQLRSFGDKLEGPITPQIKNIHKSNIFPMRCHTGQSALSESGCVGVGGEVVLEAERSTSFLCVEHYSFSRACSTLRYVKGSRNGIMAGLMIILPAYKSIYEGFISSQVTSHYVIRPLPFSRGWSSRKEFKSTLKYQLCRTLAMMWMEQCKCFWAFLIGSQ